MKSVLLAICCIWTFWSKAQTEIGELKFEETVFDFGTVLQKTGTNTKITHDFVVTNVGKKPITITKVESACECVVSKWTQTPILPTKKGKITVEYDASTPGVFLKYVQVFTNGKPEQKTLFIYGSVEKSLDTKGIQKSN
ncbi:MAG: DUF1573 domain-containing protein [Bacteroidia bacterium]|nr:DUF1573 domain-containing protein [Bacteroidia bacterium]